MRKISISKEEYAALRRQSAAYRKLLGRVFEALTRDSVDDVARDFRATGLYSPAFLADFASGLRKSSYGRK